MQHKQRLALARRKNLLVQIRRLPGLELLGLVCGRLAFIAKSVFGRFSVFFSSNGSVMDSVNEYPF